MPLSFISFEYRQKEEKQDTLRRYLLLKSNKNMNIIDLPAN